MKYNNKNNSKIEFFALSLSFSFSVPIVIRLVNLLKRECVRIRKIHICALVFPQSCVKHIKHIFFVEVNKVIKKNYKRNDEIDPLSPLQNNRQTHNFFYAEIQRLQIDSSSGFHWMIGWQFNLHTTIFGLMSEFLSTININWHSQYENILNSFTIKVFFFFFLMQTYKKCLRIITNVNIHCSPVSTIQKERTF